MNPKIEKAKGKFSFCLFLLNLICQAINAQRQIKRKAIIAPANPKITVSNQLTTKSKTKIS